MSDQLKCQVTVIKDIYPLLFEEIGSMSARNRASRILLLAEMGLQKLGGISTNSPAVSPPNVNAVSDSKDGASEPARNPHARRGSKKIQGLRQSLNLG